MKRPFIFRLESVHAGHTFGQVAESTGFAFDRDAEVKTTPAPSARELELLRGTVAREIAANYPEFARRLWNIGVPA